MKNIKIQLTRAKNAKSRGAQIHIYTDGSCIGNPGPGGWAVIILNGAEQIILKGRNPETTNNRMEMTAIIEALKWMTKNSVERAEIFSDSNLLIQSLTKNWKRKKNKDLWSELDKYLKGKVIQWTWVKGHADDKYNKKADKIAFTESIKAKKMPQQTEEIKNIQQKLF